MNHLAKKLMSSWLASISTIVWLSSKAVISFPQTFSLFGVKIISLFASAIMKGFKHLKRSNKQGDI